MRALAWTAVLVGITVAAVKRLHQEARPAWPCALHGHNDLLVFGEAGRLFMRCDTCQRETPGWDLVRAKELA